MENRAFIFLIIVYENLAQCLALSKYSVMFLG